MARVQKVFSRLYTSKLLYMYIYDVPIWTYSSILTRRLGLYRKFNTYIEYYLDPFLTRINLPKVFLF